MKRIVFCIVIAAVIIVLGISTLAYTSKVTDKIYQDLEQIQTEFTSGDTEAAKATAARMIKHWQSFREMHFLTLDNDHYLEITVTAKRLESLLEKEDEEALIECEVMKELVKVYGRKQVPDIMNLL